MPHAIRILADTDSISISVYSTAMGQDKLLGWLSAHPLHLSPRCSRKSSLISMDKVRTLFRHRSSITRSLKSTPFSKTICVGLMTRIMVATYSHALLSLRLTPNVCNQLHPSIPEGSPYRTESSYTILVCSDALIGMRAVRRSV